MSNNAFLKQHSALVYKKNPHLGFALMHLPGRGKKRLDPCVYSNIDLTQAPDRVFCYGIDIDLFNRLLLPYLNRNTQSQIFFLEEDGNHLSYILAQAGCKGLIEDSRVHIYSGASREVLTRQLALKSLFSPFYWVVPFDKKSCSYKEAMCVTQAFEKERREMEMELSVYGELGVDRARCALEHIEHMARGKDFKWGPALRGTCKGKTLVVCGAGPSLKSGSSWIKEVREKVVVLAAGSAISMLERVDIKPDFAAVIDPNPPTSRYSKTPFLENIALFYQMQTSLEVVKAFKKEKILWGCSAMFGFEELFFKEMNRPTTPMRVGWHAGTFAAHIGAYLGFDKIVLVGLEGVCVAEEQYAFEVEKKTLETMHLTAKNFRGESVKTKPDFLKGAEEIEFLIKHYPDTQFFAFDDSGLKIQGCAILPQDKEGFLKNSAAIEPGFCTRVIDQCRDLDVENEKLCQVKKRFKRDLQECKEWNGAMLDIYREKIEKAEESGMDCYQESLLVTDPFFCQVIEPIWQVFKHIFSSTDENVLSYKIQRSVFIRDILNKYLKLF